MNPTTRTRDNDMSTTLDAPAGTPSPHQCLRPRGPPLLARLLQGARIAATHRRALRPVDGARLLRHAGTNR